MATPHGSGRGSPRPFVPWLAFLALVVVWGSGFAFTRVGLQELPPVTLAVYRVGLGIIGVGIWLLLVAPQKGPLLALSPGLIVLGIVNVAATFMLISWGQQYVPSGVAAILVGSVPLFAIAIATMLRHEAFSLRAAVGVCVGFLGVVVLFSGPEDLTMNAQPGEAFVGSLAIVGSAVMIASCAVYASRLPGHLSVGQITLTQLVVAFPVVVAAAVLLERPDVGLIRTPQTLPTFAILGWMGILGAGLANLLFYSLLVTWGVTRTTLITYVMPIVGVALGVSLLGERFDLRLAIATLLVVSGVAAVHASSRAENGGARPEAES